MNKELALKIAQRLKEEFQIGNWSRFCDEIDWDNASDEEIVNIILEVCGDK